jgi:hypothetical protein
MMKHYVNRRVSSRRSAPRHRMRFSARARFPRLLSCPLVWSSMLVVLGCGSCVTSPRSDAANSGAPSSPATVEQAKAETVNTPPPASEVEAAPARPAQAPAAESRAFASPPAPAAAKKSATRRAADKAAPSPASGRATPASDESAAPREMLQDALQPSPTDSPLLRQALENLLSAAQALSAGHSCEEGCKAYESMQRAANRICELAPGGGPLDRCAAARLRVSSADQELRRRCGSCSK